MNELDLLDEKEITEILISYRSQQLREHMLGPIVSFIIHVICLVILSVYVVAKPHQEIPPIEVSIQEIEIKEIPEKIIEEIEVMDDSVDDFTPQVTMTDAPSTDMNDTALSDISDDIPESDDNMETETVLDVVTHQTPLVMPSLYGGRSDKGKSGALKRYGGNKSGQDAVLKALRWLASVQESNGSWANNPAHSGLALLCFLAHGETPLSEEFGVVVQKSMQWLANGMPEGKHWQRAYSHGIATYALAEAYGMTQIPFVRSAMENGIQTIISGQQADGGFDYNYKKGARWDLSVSGWQMQAMKAAWVSGSSNSDLSKSIEKAIDFTKNAYKNGTFGYSSPGGSQNLTGTGALSLQLLGEKNCKEAVGGCEWILDNRLGSFEKAEKDWSNANSALYGWYYDTQAIFQRQGRDWDKWNKIFQKTLIKNQNSIGYWETEGHIGGANTAGRVLTTTFCCLQLEVYYRYLPTFNISKENFVKKSGILENEAELLIR